MDFQAEWPGFEPGIRFWRIHAFQACLFSHSSTTPISAETITYARENGPYIGFRMQS